jgi:hypothetical protein
MSSIKGLVFVFRGIRPILLFTVSNPCRSGLSCAVLRSLWSCGSCNRVVRCDLVVYVIVCCCGMLVVPVFIELSLEDQVILNFV